MQFLIYPSLSQGGAYEPLAEAKQFFSPFQPKSHILMGSHKKILKGLLGGLC